MTNAKPAAQMLLERYWQECATEGNVDLVYELCADPITRHDPGGDSTLSHAQQIERLQVGFDLGIEIVRVITHATDEWATSVWNMHTDKGDDRMEMSGIEVFKVEDGVLAHCWNTPYAPGHWLPFDTEDGATA